MFLLISTPLMDMGMSLNSLSFIFICTISNLLIDLACFLSFLLQIYCRKVPRFRRSARYMPYY
jgi:hypothetical protein